MQFILCQTAIVAVVVAVSALFVPTMAVSIAMGALAVVLPNALIGLSIRRAGAGAVVVYAMLRSLVVASVVVVAYLAFELMAGPYLAGAGIGIALVVFVPIVLELTRQARVRRQLST